MEVKENLEAMEILNSYSRCSLPNLAAECRVSKCKNELIGYADEMGVTYELFSAWLDGTEELTFDETILLIKRMNSLSRNPFSFDYALKTKLSYYDLSRKRHYNKVKRVYIAFELARRSSYEFRHFADLMARGNIMSFDEVVKRGVITRAYINMLILYISRVEADKKDYENRQIKQKRGISKCSVSCFIGDKVR